MLSTLLLSLAAAAPATDVVAVQAGTIYTVDGGRVIEGGGTVLLSGGKILAVGKTVEIPAGARVVDYGPSAVIAPGLVAADSGYGGRIAADRTAEPGLSALDEFDLWGNYAAGLAGGVTTVYVAPAPGRLIGGTGAVVKLGGAPGEGRVLNGAAALDGSISADARQTPGYWEPPVPATVDVVPNAWAHVMHHVYPANGPGAPAIVPGLMCSARRSCACAASSPSSRRPASPVRSRRGGRSRISRGRRG